MSWLVDDGQYRRDPVEGGDPACWLERVCPECGLFAEHELPTRCAHCGADVAGD